MYAKIDCNNCLYKKVQTQEYLPKMSFSKMDSKRREKLRKLRKLRKRRARMNAMRVAARMRQDLTFLKELLAFLEGPHQDWSGADLMPPYGGSMGKEQSGPSYDRGLWKQSKVTPCCGCLKEQQNPYTWVNQIHHTSASGWLLPACEEKGWKPLCSKHYHDEKSKTMAEETTCSRGAYLFKTTGTIGEYCCEKFKPEYNKPRNFCPGCFDAWEDTIFKSCCGTTQQLVPLDELRKTSDKKLKTAAEEVKEDQKEGCFYCS